MSSVTPRNVQSSMLWICCLNSQKQRSTNTLKQPDAFVFMCRILQWVGFCTLVLVIDMSFVVNITSSRQSALWTLKCLEGACVFL